MASVNPSGNENVTSGSESLHSTPSQDNFDASVSDPTPGLTFSGTTYSSYVSEPTSFDSPSEFSGNFEGETRKTKTVAVIGAGLVGCVAALAFAKKGYNVRVYEGRPDARSPEQREIFSFRSINMAVSARGILTLESIDTEMAGRALKNLIPMYGRMIHDGIGNEFSQKYGLYGEAINSIDRADLNRGLLDELDKAGVETYFNYKLINAVFKPHNSLTFSVIQDENGKIESDSFKRIEVVDDIDVVIGCDGAHSAVRTHLGKYVRLNFDQQYIDSAYVELRIESQKHQEYDLHAQDEERKFKLDRNHLHIWPRHKHMLIAMPNTDGSFTSTLFAPWKVFNEQLVTEDEWFDFFWTNFPDVFEKGLMTKEMLVKAYHENPRGSLVCVRCSPYNYQGNVILLGDAAHSMVPFYGQGMNCGFEDVRVLMGLMEKNNFDFEAAFNEYTETRHEDLNAILDLAMRNYVEMRHGVVSRAFALRKKLDGFLSRSLGNYWLPLYTMVSFRPDIPYGEALRRETKQSKIVHDIVYYGTGAAIAAGCLIVGKALRKMFS